MPSFLIGPCLMVILPADLSTLVTWPAMRDACEPAVCADAHNAIATSSACAFILVFLLSVLLRRCWFWLDRFDRGGALRRRLIRTPRRFTARFFDFIRQGARRVLIGARIAVVIAAEPFPDFHDREHAAHLDRPELAEARHHRQRI